MASSSSSTAYPYPSVAVNVESFVPVKLKGIGNYPVWKEQMLCLIGGHGMLGFIDGEILAPSEKLTVRDVDGEIMEIRNPDYELWRRSNWLVKGWICGALSEELVQVVVPLQTAQKVWSVLEQLSNRERGEVSPDEEDGERKSSVINIRYPYPSVAVNVESFVPFKLKGKRDYPLWKKQMLCLIGGHGMLGFIDGKILAPSEELTVQDDVDGKIKQIGNPDYELWRRSDWLVQGWIVGALSGGVTRELSDRALSYMELWSRFTRELVWFQSANQMWSWLQDKYDPNIDEISPDEKEGEEAVYMKYSPLYTAIMQSDWDSAKSFLDQETDAATTPINSLEETALHVAVGTNIDIGFVQNLVNFIMERKDKDSLANQDNRGNTALHTAARAGNKKAAMLLVDRNPHLLKIENHDGSFPSLDLGTVVYRDTLVYFLSLYKQDPQHKVKTGDGRWLFSILVSSGLMDLAAELLEDYPDAIGSLEDCKALLNFMVNMPSLFRSGSSFYLWQLLIYCCIPLQLKSGATHRKSSSGDTEDPPSYNAQICKPKFTRFRELIYEGKYLILLSYFSFPWYKILFQ